MTITWKNTQGKMLTGFVQGEDRNCNMDDCYVVSFQPNSPKVFYVRKAEVL